MKKILKRLCAYMIDIMVVMIITQCLSGVPLINRQLDNYNKYYQEYSNHLKEYTDFKPVSYTHLTPAPGSWRCGGGGGLRG